MQALETGGTCDQGRGCDVSTPQSIGRRECRNDRRDIALGHLPDFDLVISFRAATSTTDTLLSCALATYSFLLSGEKVIQSGTLPTFTAPRYFRSGIEYA